MRINTHTGLAPIAAIIIALLVIGGGAYGVKKVADKKKEKGGMPAAEAGLPTAPDAAQAGMPVPGTDTGEMAARVTTLQVKLDEQNKSGQNGQAVITLLGTSTLKVIVNLTGLPAATRAAQAGIPSGVAQPAHIHIGACPTPGAVKYPLTNVDRGSSQTEISNLTLQQLLGELPLAINVHRSAAEASVYAACGNIVKEETSAVKKNEGAMTQKEEKKSEGAMTAGKEVKVNYTSAGFAPKSVTVKKGDTVVFENKTGRNASVASDEHPTHLLYPEFDQYKTAERGKSEFRFTFDKAGTWKYHDHLNAAMTGTVVVTE